MINAVGVPQSLLLLGGTSDIALAIADEYARRTTRLRVIVAARPSSDRDAAVARLESAGCEPVAIDFDALDTESHRSVIDEAADGGDIDITVVAFGLLGDQEDAWTNQATAIKLAQVNYVGAVSCGVLLGDLVQRQGHGVIVALSSVAAERPRRSNFAYGSTKAGMDSFYTGLGEALREHGGHVLVVRPGFVHSAMTEGLDPAPLAATPKDVATAVVSAVGRGKTQIWVPAALRGVMSGLRHVPRPIFRKLPL